ncbi:MAG: hypothetical protein BMS9Abin29_0989 [Gemmatimonadota bacterium]|nr:MAG: hypothetical protein BMS9Abin29_0989 [Gemmatimonadota bacterium]
MVAASAAALFAAVLGLEGPVPPVRAAEASVACGVTGPPEYYSFPLVSTKRVPGSGQATGLGELTFAPSPFGFALSPEGNYRYRVSLTVDRLAPPATGVYVVWVTTPSLDRIELAGAFDDRHAMDVEVDFNKFLVVITLEDAYDPEAAVWSGPIVLRGMSRSGMMHTMAGHGPFEQENCAAYGY